jgi:arabinogalactan oligomer / maltooligosaccharide transport system permease protein
MVNWSGRRKSLMILLFTGPMLLGLLVFNVYPIVFSFFISLTNRNRFRPFPDCNVTLTKILEPTCWGVTKAQTGLGQPYKLVQPIYQNYADLIGQFFTGGSLLNLAKILAVFVPLIVASQVNKRMGQRLDRPVSGAVVWLVGLLGALAVAVLVNLPVAYNTLINAGDFVGVIVQTVLYVVIRVPLTLGLAMALALLLNSSFLPGRTFFRVVLFIPWAASSLSILIALIWQFFFRDQGTINQFLELFGIDGPAYLTQDWWAFAAIVITDIWFSYPFLMIIILGALQSIPADQYEAAEIDGATWGQQFSNITLPLLRPAILPAIVLTSITAFQMFGTAYAITTGGPSKGAGKPGFTEFVMVYAYKQVFTTQAYGRMGAFAVIIFILLFAATLYSLRITRITKGAYE